jgi:hypothetical protein
MACKDASSPGNLGMCLNLSFIVSLLQCPAGAPRSCGRPKAGASAQSHPALASAFRQHGRFRIYRLARRDRRSVLLFCLRYRFISN